MTLVLQRPRMEASTSWRCVDASPQALERAQVRFMKKWRSHSQVYPMAPWTWSATRAARAAASEAIAWAIEASCETVGCDVARDQAARYVAGRANSNLTRASASRCLTAWKLPMGLPNCWRSLD